MIQAPLATVKKVNGVPGLPLTFTMIQAGRANDGTILAHGTRVGDVIVAATDMANAADVKAKFTSPTTVDGLISQSDSDADHSTAVVLFVIQRG